MKEAVERIIRSLVAEPDAVEVVENTDGKNVRIEVRVADTDIGPMDGFCVVYPLFELVPGSNAHWEPRYRYG